MLGHHPVTGRDRHRTHEEVTVVAGQALVQHGPRAAGGEGAVRDDDSFGNTGCASREADGGGRLRVGAPASAGRAGGRQQALISEAVVATDAHHRAGSRRSQLGGQLGVGSVAEDDPGLDLLDDRGQLAGREPLVERRGDDPGRSRGVEVLVVLQAVLGQHRGPVAGGQAQPAAQADCGCTTGDAQEFSTVHASIYMPRSPAGNRLPTRPLAG